MEIPLSAAARHDKSQRKQTATYLQKNSITYIHFPDDLVRSRIGFHLALEVDVGALPYGLGNHVHPDPQTDNRGVCAWREGEKEINGWDMRRREDELTIFLMFFFFSFFF